MIGLAGDPVGETLGFALGDAAGEPVVAGDATEMGETAGLGLAIGLFGTSGLRSHAPSAAIPARRVVASNTRLFIFYLKYFTDRGPAVRWQTPQPDEGNVLSAVDPEKDSQLPSPPTLRPIERGWIENLQDFSLINKKLLSGRCCTDVPHASTATGLRWPAMQPPAIGPFA